MAHLERAQKPFQSKHFQNFQSHKTRIRDILELQTGKQAIVMYLTFHLRFYPCIQIKIPPQAVRVQN